MSLVPPHVKLPEDQALLVEAARDFARGELHARDRKWDQNESSVAEILPELGEMGLLNLCVPQKANGLGCPYRVYAAILHEISTWSPSTAVTISVHSMVGSILNKWAAEPQRSEWLATWGDPGSFSAFAVSEAGAGSDSAGVKTAAVEVEGGLILNGEKMWVTNGMHARWFLTLARLQGGKDDDAFCAVLVDGNQPGVERTSINGKMGIRGSETAVAHLTDVFVPDAHVIGDRNRGLQVCLSALNEGRIGIAVQATGIAEACLTEMTSYARQREQFGQPIGKFQAVGDMIAESAVELEASKALVWYAACKVDAGKPDRVASA
jgi:alkylation response protein AidB-like acyl-CoA dehydrogenase